MSSVALGRLALLATRIQRAYRHGAFADFLEAAFTIPEVLREAAGMDRVVFVVDDADTLRTRDLVDWRTNRTIDADLLSALVQHLRTSNAGCIATSMLPPHTLVRYNPAAQQQQQQPHGLTPDSSIAMNTEQGVVVATCGMVSDEAAIREAGLPSVIECSGRQYPLRIFGGCPAYLATLRKHLVRGRALVPLGDGRAEVTDPNLGAVLEELERLRLDDRDLRGDFTL
jgi:hypothetical protein